MCHITSDVREILPAAKCSCAAYAADGAAMTTFDETEPVYSRE